MSQATKEKEKEATKLVTREFGYAVTSGNRGRLIGAHLPSLPVAG